MKLRQQVKDLWRDHIAGRSSLTAAAMATNAAIALANQMEKELFDSIELKEKLGNGASTVYHPLPTKYGELIAIVIANICGETSGMVLDPVSALGDNADYWLFDIALIMIKLQAGFVLRNKQQGSVSAHKLKGASPVKSGQTKFRFWPHVETLEFFLLTYCVCPGLAMKSPKFTGLKRMDDYMTPLLIDTILRTLHLQNMDATRAPSTIMHLDEATSRIANDYDLGPTTLWSATILHDLHLMLGTRATDIFTSMRKSIDEAWNLIKAPVYELDHGTLDLLPFWQAEDINNLGTIEGLHMLATDEIPAWDQALENIVRDQPPSSFHLSKGDLRTRLESPAKRFHDDWASRMSQMRRYQLHFIHPTFDTSRCWTGNPLACGTLSYNLAIAKERAGICLANSEMSIIIAAYVYQACRSGKALQGRWTEMDGLIDEHIVPMFFGSIDKDPDQMLNAWTLRMGLQSLDKTKQPMQNRVNVGGWGGDRTGTWSIKKAQGSCLSITDTAHEVAQWFEGKKPLIRALYAIQGHIIGQSPGYVATQNSSLSVDLDANEIQGTQAE